MKIPSRTRVYGAITLISAILGIPGIVFQVYAFIDEQGDREKQSIEIAKKVEAEALHGKIIQARAYLENCTMTEVLRTNISLTLDRAEKELTLNDNSTGSRALYVGVITDVIQCERIMPEPPLSAFDNPPPVYTGPTFNPTTDSANEITGPTLNSTTDSANEINRLTDSLPPEPSNQQPTNSPLTESNDTPIVGPIIEHIRANLSLESNNTQIGSNPPGLDIGPQELQTQLLRFLYLPLFALTLAGVFGFLWYRTSKRQSTERPSG